MHHDLDAAFHQVGVELIEDEHNAVALRDFAHLLKAAWPRRHDGHVHQAGFHDEAGGRLVIGFHLADSGFERISIIERNRHGQRHKGLGDAGFALDALQFGLHLTAQLEIQRRQRFIEQQHLGLFAKARANATRCCWPPESWLGRHDPMSAKCTRSSMSATIERISDVGFFSISNPNATLSATLIGGGETARSFGTPC